MILKKKLGDLLETRSWGRRSLDQRLRAQRRIAAGSGGIGKVAEPMSTNDDSGSLGKQGSAVTLFGGERDSTVRLKSVYPLSDIEQQYSA